MWWKAALHPWQVGDDSHPLSTAQFVQMNETEHIQHILQLDGWSAAHEMCGIYEDFGRQAHAKVKRACAKRRIPRPKCTLNAWWIVAKLQAGHPVSLGPRVC